MAVLFRPIDGIAVWRDWCGVGDDFTAELVQTRRSGQSRSIFGVIGLGIAAVFRADFACGGGVDCVGISVGGDVIYVS